MIKEFFFFTFIGTFILNFAQALPTLGQNPRVKRVYDQLQGQLIWIQNGTWTSCGNTLLQTLAHAGEEGLWDEDYTPFVKTLQKADLKSLEGQQRADEILTLAALNYISDMK